MGSHIDLESLRRQGFADAFVQSQEQPAWPKDGFRPRCLGSAPIISASLWAGTP